MTNATCKDCKFWEKEDQIKETGFCRRYAPRSKNINPVEVGSTIDAIWPRTNADDWCGEWEEKL